MTRRSLALAAVLALSAGPVAAQSPNLVEVPDRDGFWIGFGFGGGWTEFDFDFGTEGRGAGGFLRMGGTVNQHVLFGGEVLFWYREDAGVEVSRGAVTASALLYPGARSGFFVKPGFGVAVYEIGNVSREGVALTLGTGYDFRMGSGNFYVTPNVDLMVQLFDDDTNATLLFTLGVVWH